MRANFSVSETEYIASSSIQQQEEQQQQSQKQQPIPQVIYSNAKDLVEQRNMFLRAFGTRQFHLTKDSEK